MTDRPKRPRDANQLAKFIVDVATGEIETNTAAKTQQKAAGVVGWCESRISPQQRTAIKNREEGC